MYNLRELFFTYEDRKQISKLILETMNRLSVATGGKSMAKDLWHTLMYLIHVPPLISVPPGNSVDKK